MVWVVRASLWRLCWEYTIEGKEGGGFIRLMQRCRDGATGPGCYAEGRSSDAAWHVWKFQSVWFDEESDVKWETSTVKMTPRFLFWAAGRMGLSLTRMGRLWAEWIGGQSMRIRSLFFGEASLRCLLYIRKCYLLGSWVCKPTIWVKSMSNRYNGL